MKMKYTGLSIVILLLCYGCGNDNRPTKTHKEVIAEEGFAEDTLGGGIYKHYTGTIAGQPVVLHYMQYGSTIRGTYYYENIGQAIELYNYPDSSGGGNLYLAETPATERIDNTAYWQVTVAGDSLTGTWISGNRENTYPIILKEDYTNGVQSFGIVCADDSVKLKDNLDNPKAYTSCQMLLPVGNDDATAFIRSVIYRSMKCDTNSTDGIKSCLDLLNRQYFATYKEENSEDDSLLMTSPSFYNWSRMTNFWVVYNQDNITVLNHHNYEYLGGAHGVYSSNYLCLDARNKKVLTLKDILNINEPELVKLLEKEARKLYHAKDTEPLNAYMLAEELYVPEQFYITGKGITFVYGIYEVASYAEGEINLFIPYTKVKNMLTPYIVERMKLQTSLAHK